MSSFPRSVTAKAPPIKTQGIKTKLVPFILSNIVWDGHGRWIEPFLGSGVVLFNAQPKRALVADTNKHIIAVYQAIQSGSLTGIRMRDFLEREGALLASKGECHYYEVRERFNQLGSPYDFLFLNRSCFNGVMRFNSKGRFNVPFCRKEKRFDPSYVTRICNQIDWVSTILEGRDWVFAVQDWRITLAEAAPSDFIYLDPPYVGRHTDYFGQWSEESANELAVRTKELGCSFAYSMWKKNKYRENEHLNAHFSNYRTVTMEHFYHVGSSEDLRNSMEEALVTSMSSVPQTPASAVAEQLALI